MAVKPSGFPGPPRGPTSAVADELRSLRKLADERRAASVVLFRRTARPEGPPRGKAPRNRKPLAA
ncbi:MAG: hypothetical protein ISP45_11490 [Reyranella sp.]|nr:hypothetical protein [Reyranella sp.]